MKIISTLTALGLLTAVSVMAPTGNADDAAPAAAAPSTTAPAASPSNAVNELRISNHVFFPAEIHVPAGKTVSIKVKNEDATAEEFDSDDLKVEKVVAGKSEGIVRLRPLKPGRYKFAGEYHEDTAKGVVIAE